MQRPSFRPNDGSDDSTGPGSRLVRLGGFGDELVFIDPAFSNQCPGAVLSPRICRRKISSEIEEGCNGLTAGKVQNGL